MKQIARRVVAFIRHEGLLGAGDGVVVGVSGGPDSLCLLHILDACRQELGIQLHVAHLNHLIRGLDAEQDAHFVTEMAAQWGLPCTVEARDVPAIARQQKLALEEAARRSRYAFLLQVAHQTGATRIAVAHNADDQSETVLMHWLRGAGLAGLRGMLPATHMADLRLIAGPKQGQGVWLIRPLLQVPRAEVERYCRQHGLSPRFDRSNLDTTFYRNKLRHELLPYLEKEYKPHFHQVLRRSARVIRDDYDLLCHLRDEAWQRTVTNETNAQVKFDKKAWQKLHPALQRATIREAVRRLRWHLRDINFQHVEAAVRVAHKGRAGTQATLPRRVTLTVGYTTLTLADCDWVPPPDFPTLTADRQLLPVPGQAALAGTDRVQVQSIPREALPAGWEQNTDPWLAYLDADVLGDEIHLCTRQAGDRFCPLGMGGKHKLVSDFLINEKVPAWWRDSVPLLVRADGKIMWVCGWRIDDRARVRPETTRVAVVRFSKQIALKKGRSVESRQDKQEW